MRFCSAVSGTSGSAAMTSAPASARPVRSAPVFQAFLSEPESVVQVIDQRIVVAFDVTVDHQDVGLAGVRIYWLARIVEIADPRVDTLYLADQKVRRRGGRGGTDSLFHPYRSSGRLRTYRNAGVTRGSECRALLGPVPMYGSQRTTCRYRRGRGAATGETNAGAPCTRRSWRFPWHSSRRP